MTTPPPPNHQVDQFSQPAAAKGISATSIIGLVLAIIALLLCWIPIINNIAPIFALGGIILAGIGIYSTRPAGNTRGRGIAIAGLVIGILSVIATIGTQAFFDKVVDDAFDTDSTSSETSSVAAAKGDSSAAPKGDLGEEADLDKIFHAKITEGAVSVPDYEGASTFATTVEISNIQTDKNLNPFDVHVQAFQNGVELETAIYFDAEPEGYTPGDSFKEIQPGGTQSQVHGFVLQDETNPVTIQVESTFDFNDQKVTKTFQLS